MQKTILVNLEKQNSNWLPILDLYIVHALQIVIFLLFGTKTWESFGILLVYILLILLEKFEIFFPKFFI
jgi:hypothetical protein